MRLTFRYKLLGIGAVTALAFIMLIVAGAVIAARVDAQLAAIQKRYIPRVELEPELDAQLERIERGFQDAVAAHDLDALAATRDLKDTFLRLLAASQDAVDPTEARELRASLDEYYAFALDVSRRMIAGETGEALLDAITSMQTKQLRTTQLIKATASIDRRQIETAFAQAAQAEATATSSQLWISLVCLAFVLLLSFALSRGLLRSVAEISSGFGRFGGGDFSQPIEVSGSDELYDVAQHANQMAANLDRLRREQKRVEAELTISNRELEAFSYSVAHDLRAPLRGINGFARALKEDLADKLDGETKDYLERICAGAERMGELIDALLALSRVSRVALQRETVNLTNVADGIVKQLRASHPERSVDFVNQQDVTAYGDARLLRAALENLLGNAWKFTGGRPLARISFGTARQDGALVYVVQDNGAGFDMAYAEKLFAPFQRLHSTREFVGTGIGLATVQRIVHRHGGRIWADGAVDQGATFRFTLAGSREGDSA